MPDLRNCKRCNKLFNYIGRPICPVCVDKDEVDFRRVKQYLYENQGATLSQVSLELDISVERIKSYLKEGRLEIVGDEKNLILECEACGKSIKTGRHCDECMRDLANGLKSTSKSLTDKARQEQADKKRIAMRYLSKDKL